MSDDEDFEPNEEDEDEYYDVDEDVYIEEEEVSKPGMRLLLEEDIRELKRLGYYAGYDTNSIECSVWVGFGLNQLRPEILQACGLDQSKSIAIKVVFTDPPEYCSSCPSVKAKHIFIRQTSKTDFSKIVLPDCEQFGLWWTLEQRLSEYLQGSWNDFVAKQQAVLEQLAQREKVASSANVSILMEVHGVSLEAAVIALKTATNHLDCALDSLSDEHKKHAVEAEATHHHHQHSSISRLENNILAKIIEYVKQRIEVATRYCIVCDKVHPLQLLKPVVCSQDLCNFQFTNMGLGINVEDELCTAPEACDLVISMTCAAAFSARHFEPFPSVEATYMDDDQVKEVRFNKQNARQVGEVLQRCPGVKMLVEFVKQGVLREKLEAIHPLLYKLLRWIIGTCRAHLHFITDEKQRVQGAQTPWQFVVKSTPPEKERTFQQLKEDYKGSFFSFHGSGLGNWHSILRLGLKNYSGTEKQSHGAVYGAGIYMAVDAATSLGYAGHGNVGIGWTASQFTSTCRCIALCEIVNYGDKDPKKCSGKLHRPQCKHSTTSPHFRVEMEELAVTRYFLLYHANEQLHNVLTSKLTVPGHPNVGVNK